MGQVRRVLENYEVFPSLSAPCSLTCVIISDSTDKLETELKKFLKQRSEVEKDYVGRLNRLQRNFTPRAKSSEDDSCTLVFR